MHESSTGTNVCTSVGIDCSSSGGRRSLTSTFSVHACRAVAPRGVLYIRVCARAGCIGIERGETWRNRTSISGGSKRQPIALPYLSRLIVSRKIIIEVTLEKRGNEGGVDSTCSESGLSGRAKGMGDRDDLTKGREGWWTTKMVVRASGGRKILERGEGKGKEASGSSSPRKERR
ncbi:hypothetical protein X777_03272 [Ooceraea biroi]|uniref:Uncharacterized protein n=1 Tax=Ooceraea biroi TaxID=2015173 RepID=A0A026WND1_OOCBI|nr:hypothetical protein X777_03272 [Ooceraea biroi]